MLRTTLVVIHAAAGIGGLITGLAALSPPGSSDIGRWRRLYLLCLAVLLASMVALVAIDWNGLDVGARVAFAALGGLGAVMAYRIARAYREASVRAADWGERYIGHVYFTYISLWEGFVILPALALPFPQVTVPLVAISVLVVGHTLIARYKTRLLAGMR